MRVFKNYKNEDCFLTTEQEQHIQLGHPEASTTLISKCLLAPMEIRQSSSHALAQLYYILKANDRYFCVVLKCCPDGHFITTAYTTTQIKSGDLIYKQGV